MSSTPDHSPPNAASPAGPPSSSGLNPSTWRYDVRVNLAPVALVLVALLHLYLVERHSLTPWKGGGFGMFSTVDTRTARFLRVYVQINGSDYPVRLPSMLEKPGEELRAAPSLERAQRLADELATQPWGLADQRWQRLATAMAAQEVADPLSANALRLAGENPPASLRTPLQESGESPVIVPLADGSDTALSTSDSAERLDVSSVRVEVWRYHFQQDQLQLIAQPLFTATSPPSLSVTVPTTQETAP